MGARPLRRVIEQELEDALAEKLLMNPDLKKKYLISAEDSKITLDEQDLPEEKAEEATT